MKIELKITGDNGEVLYEHELKPDTSTQAWGFHFVIDDLIYMSGFNFYPVLKFITDGKKVES